jgi:hypothetical protein
VSAPLHLLDQRPLTPDAFLALPARVAEPLPGFVTGLPQVVAAINDYEFKIVNLQGDFIWHEHRDTGEAFIVIDRNLRIDFRDGADHLSAGRLIDVM